jgi:hypothetical protein
VLDLFTAEPSRAEFSVRRACSARRRARWHDAAATRRAVLREVGDLIAEQARRARLNWRPDYVAAGRSLEAGATDVEDTVTVL